ncbi:unnamed protein product, partial [Caretta caretta]
MDPVGVAAAAAPETGPGPAWQSKCPWGAPKNVVISCSLADVMSEQLAKELQLEEEKVAFPEVVTVAEGPFITGENTDTSSDLMLAQMLQMEFDREYDAQLRREEKKFNGDSKVSISFENYRKVHPYEDSDSSEDEVDWQDTRHDPYRADKPTTTPKKGFIGKGKEITTKHDEVVCGRKNTARMENFGPDFQVGDGIGMDLKLSNQVFNALKQHAYSEERRSARLHEKKEHSTAEKAVDPKTRLILYKMVNAGILETITGCISTGKESVVFHAYGGKTGVDDKAVPPECALKRGKLQVTMQSSSAEVTMMESQNRKRAPAWTEREVRDLIAVWGEESVLSELRSSFRNAKTFLKISQGMKDRGHNRDPKQCRVKLKELRQAYQKTREANGRSGSEPQTCRFYDELHAILGGSATTTPAVLFDSFNGDGGNTEVGFGDEEDDDEEVVDSSQQASGETGFPDSQELFLTLDLEPVPPEPTQGCLLDSAGGEGTS